MFRQVSNHDDSIGFVIKFSLALSLKSVSADYNTKQRIEFNSSLWQKIDKSRTPRINFLLLYVSYFQKDINKKEKVTSFTLITFLSW